MFNADILSMFFKTKVFISSIMTVFIIALFTVISVAPDISEPVPGQYGLVEYKRNSVSAVASCGGIFLTNPVNPLYYGVIPEKYENYNLDGIPSTPFQIPTYGFMVKEPTSPDLIRVYDRNEPDAYLSFPVVNRMLWDGYKIIWYAPFFISDEELQFLKDYAAEYNKTEKKLAVIPFHMKNRTIPYNKNYAFSSWGATQSCERFNEDTFNQFIMFADENSDFHGGEPPVAPLSPEGLFFAPPPEQIK
jgi:hypothetical protein